MINHITTIIVEDDRSHKLKARTVDIDQLVRDLVESEAWIKVRHGGSVANCYGYPAYTECATAIQVGMVVLVWATELTANKVSYSGVARATVGRGAHIIFDYRYNKVNKDEARKAVKAYAAQIAKEAN